MSFNVEEHPHRRFNPLRGEWVLVSPQRTKRPWLGQVERPASDFRQAYDAVCYLCPGNPRAGNQNNPEYDSTFVFRNDFSALLPDTPGSDGFPDELLHTKPVRGECRVICFSPRHDVTLAEMSTSEIRKVVETWIAQSGELSKQHCWVQIFENKGAMMGCSNPHPHGQVWAGDFLPNEAAIEDREQKKYCDDKKSVLLVDYAQKEIVSKRRVVAMNEHWVAVVPFWAVWPFEVLLMPTRHVLHVHDLNSSEQNSLAEILGDLLVRYDNLFETSFPYSMGWHGAPNGTEDFSHWQLHAHFTHLYFGPGR